MAGVDVTMANLECEQTLPPHPQMDRATKTAMCFFLEPTHYHKLHAVLKHHWGGCHSLTAAVQLIKAHGGNISPEEEAQLTQLGARSEEAMIETLVDYMPREKPEQFEHFFLQLSFIASTTTRLRTALESGHPDYVEEALESADNVGVLQYLLKMAVAQAGQEVQTIDSEHDSWLGATEGKMGPLLTSAVAAMEVEKELSQAKSTIEHFRLGSREKSRSVLHSMMEANDASLLSNVFGAFAAHVRTEKREREIAHEYEDKLHAMQEERFKFKQAQVTHVRTLVKAQVQSGLEELMAICFHALRVELDANKEMFRLSEEEKELKQQIDEFAASNSKQASSLMNRVAEHTNQGLLSVAFESLKLNLQESRHEREVEEQMRVTKARMAQMESKQKSFGKSMLTSVLAQGDAALRQAVFINWSDMFKKEREEQTLAAKTAAKSAQLQKFTEHSKTSSLSAADKVAWLEDQQVLTYALLTWKRESKYERICRLGRDKNDKRKKELIGVRGLFKSFAQDLETNLTNGTPRVESPQQLRSGPRAN